MQKKKKPYEKPQVSLVKLNPAQAVLSVCSTTFSTLDSTSGGTRCRSGKCKKRSTSGDSLGQS